MKITRCPMRHFYNADVLPDCPLCSRQRPKPQSAPPLVGWLVGLQDPFRGREWVLQSGYNYLCFRQDIALTTLRPSVSELGAVIGYDPEAGQFSIAPAGSRIVRINGTMILQDTALAAYDRISVDSVSFLFVPLCGQQFSWNSQETEGVVL